MAVDKLVDSTQLDADLTSVANAIRTKGGTSSQLAFPAGFVSAVQAIPTGVTPTGTKNISITANGVTTEDVTNYASAQITANVPNTYSAGDEGKVVSNGALVAQGSDTVTQNDTYDTTLISSLTVNVSGSIPNLGAAGSMTPSELFDALAKGEYSTGTVSVTSYYPTTESLFCDTGYNGNLGGMLIFCLENPSVPNAAYSLTMSFGIFLEAESGDQTETSRGTWKAGTFSGAKMFGDRMTSYRVNGGKLYITPKYNTLNGSYFLQGKSYRWIAWPISGR